MDFSPFFYMYIYMKKNYLFYVVIIALFCVLAYFTRSYTKSLEIEKNQYKAKYESTKTELIVEKEKSFKLSLEINKLKERNVDIIDIKNADGSSKKITKIRNKDKTNIKNKNEVKLIDNKKEIKEENKVIIEDKKENKKEVVKKSNWVLPIVLIGGIALCIGTGVCVF